MLFEVIDLNGNRMMFTEYIECIPDADVLTMIDASSKYRFKLDSKVVSLASLIKKLRSIAESSEHYAANNGNYNINYSTDLEAALKSFSYPVTSRTVYCIETKTMFKSQADAARQYGLDPVSLSYSISKQQPCNGYTFIRVK